MSLTNGLVSYWKLDENSGTTVFDSVGSNDGTASHTGILGSAGKINNGGTFNGSTNKITIPHNSSLNITPHITIGAWVKTNALTTTQYIINKRVFNSTNGWELSYAVSGKCFVRFNEQSSGNTFRLNSLSNYTTDWQYWVATYDGTTIRLYLNGVLNNSLTATLTIGINTINAVIGADTTTGNNTNGLIDEIGIWNRALTQAEITELYNVGDGLQYPFASGKRAGFLMKNF